MKKFTKSVIAVLMTVLMICSVLPVAVFADNMSWTWTVTIFGGNFYRKDGIETSTNKYTTNQHIDNSEDHDIGYKFEWNQNAGGSIYDGGWQLCMTVDDEVVERTTAYVYTRNMSNASGSWTAPASSHTGTSSHPFTLSLSSFPAADYTKQHDITLTYDANGGAFADNAKIKTETKTGNASNPASFVITDSEPKLADHTFQGWSSTENGSVEYTAEQTLSISDNKTLYAVWEATTPDKPKAPEKNDINGIIGDPSFLKIVCKDNDEHNISFTIGPDVITSISDSVLKDDVYTVTVTVDGTPFIPTYNTQLKQSGVTVEHELDDDTTKSFDLVYNGEKWVVADNYKNGITFEVKEKTTPTEKHDEPILTKTADKNTANAGESVNFKLDVTLPDYLGNFLDPRTPGDPEIATQSNNSYPMTIKDSYDSNFENPTGFVVSIVRKDAEGNETVTAIDNKYYTIKYDTNAFDIDFDLAPMYADNVITNDDLDNINNVSIRVTYTLNVKADAVAGKFENKARIDYENKNSVYSSAYVNVYAIKINKLDNEDHSKFLEGAKFKLYIKGENGTRTPVGEEMTTGTDGTLTFAGLKGGTYIIEETEAPQGYFKGRDYEITLSGDGNIISVNFFNTKVPSTGSDTALIFSIAGIAIVGAGFAGYAITRKKREN